MQNNNTDPLLLQWIAAGNEGAFQKFYNTNIHYVTNIVRKYRGDGNMAEEDLVQEIFLSLWKYRSNLTAVKNIDYYLFRTARNKVLQFQIAAMKRTNVSLEDVTSNLLRLEPQDDIDYKQLLHIYRQTVRFLPRRQQHAFHLRHEVGLSREEVSDKMGITISTVKNLNKAAKQKLWCAVKRLIQ